MATARAHPGVMASFVVCTLGGGLLGVWLLDPSWPVVRRIAAGGILGAAVPLYAFVTRLLSAA